MIMLRHILAMGIYNGIKYAGKRKILLNVFRQISGRWRVRGDIQSAKCVIINKCKFQGGVAETNRFSNVKLM
jgi:hypothetical protein